MLVVGFYTFNTPYQDEILHLEKSCKQFGLKYKFMGYEVRGSWVLNCAIKPEFLLEMLMNQEDDLLYVDADAVFMQEPKLFNNDWDADIAAHVRDGGELLSGTIYLKNCDNVKQLVREWCKKQATDYNKWDQKTLQEVIALHGPRLGIKFINLPREYTKIFDKDWGDPVIQHNQKSRVYREKVNMSILDGVPSSINGQRITVHGDGSFTIPRRHTQAEAFMNSNYTRIKGELRWVKRTHANKNIMELSELFKGKKIYLVGKGPSLDELTSQAFDDETAPVMCINESVHKVESFTIKNPIFAVQQDAGLRNACQPRRGAIIVSSNAQHWYADTKNKYVYNARDMGLSGSQLTAICAIEIAKMLGAKGFTMISFDACVTKETAYAKCIGRPSSDAGDPNRFLNHRKHFENHLLKDTTWVTPMLHPSVASSYKPEHTSNNQQEHRVPDHKEYSASNKETLEKFSETVHDQLEKLPGHSDTKQSS